MQRSAGRIMNGLKGGDVVMESLEAEHAVRRARDCAPGAGRTRSKLRLIFSCRIEFAG